VWGCRGTADRAARPRTAPGRWLLRRDLARRACRWRAGCGYGDLLPFARWRGESMAPRRCDRDLAPLRWSAARRARVVTTAASLCVGAIGTRPATRIGHPEPRSSRCVCCRSHSSRSRSRRVWRSTSPRSTRPLDRGLRRTRVRQRDEHARGPRDVGVRILYGGASALDNRATTCRPVDRKWTETPTSRRKVLECAQRLAPRS